MPGASLGCPGTPKGLPGGVQCPGGSVAIRFLSQSLGGHPYSSFSQSFLPPLGAVGLCCVDPAHDRVGKNEG